MAVHVLEQGLLLTSNNRLPANPSLCAQRLVPFLPTILSGFPACYVREVLAPREASEDCESRSLFLFGARTDIRFVPS